MFFRDVNLCFNHETLWQPENKTPWLFHEPRFSLHISQHPLAFLDCSKHEKRRRIRRLCEPIWVWNFLQSVSRESGVVQSSTPEWFFSLTSTLATVCIFSMTSAFSSAGNMLGTSPVLRIMLISSTNDSSLIWLSLNRNTVALPSTPALINICKIILSTLSLTRAISPPTLVSKIFN